jgi:hypothetical protein
MIISGAHGDIMSAPRAALQADDLHARLGEFGSDHAAGRTHADDDDIGLPSPVVAGFGPRVPALPCDMASALMKASAWMVSVGLKPLIDGKVELPMTNRLGISQVWPYLFTIDLLGSLPAARPMMSSRWRSNSRR